LYSKNIILFLILIKLKYVDYEKKFIFNNFLNSKNASLVLKKIKTNNNKIYI